MIWTPIEADAGVMPPDGHLAEVGSDVWDVSALEKLWVVHCLVRKVLDKKKTRSAFWGWKGIHARDRAPEKME